MSHDVTPYVMSLDISVSPKIVLEKRCNKHLILISMYIIVLKLF